MRVLEAHSKLGRCQVEEIHRQIPEDYRAVVTQMATGNVRQGLEGLERMNWIREGRSDYLGKAASDFLRPTDQGRHQGRRLTVSLTWEENHRFTDSIPKGLKERGVLRAEGMRLKVHESLHWTNQQKGNWQRYELGQVVLLPAPFSPTRAWTSPGYIVRSTPLSAHTPGETRTNWTFPSRVPGLHREECSLRCAMGRLESALHIASCSSKRSIASCR